MRRVLAALLALAGSAHAGPWVVTLEGGGEADSNVTRTETTADDKPVSAAVARAGARIEHKDRLLGGAYGLGLSGLARVVGDGALDDENVALLTGELRWMHPVGTRPLAVGFDALAADALAMSGGTGARTFRNLGGDALLALRSGDDRLLTLGIGWRDFRYKPVTTHDFDWNGGSASARLDLTLWQTSNKTRTLELATTISFEGRRYANGALENSCPPEDVPRDTCLQGTSVRRRDRYTRGIVELDWIGSVVASLGYQLIVIDSNSYGQSLIRHRIFTSGTMELGWKIFGTASVAIQLDKYTDGVIVEAELLQHEYTSLEDENRSSVQVRLARPINPAWSVEVRAALWRDLTSTMNSSFSRELAYAGVIYSR